MPDPKLDLSRAPRIADMINAWFCPQCGLRDETMRGIDQDGTCSSCGSDCCTWDSVRGHLAHYGWEVVSADDARELSRIRAEATADPASDMKKRERGCECHLEEGDSPCIVHGLYEADQPSLRWRAKDVDGWKLSEEYPGYVEYSRGNQDVSFDGSEIEARETVSGYEGWTAVVRISAALLRELLPTVPRAQLTSEERAVLEACDDLGHAQILDIHSVDRELGNLLLARRAARKESKP